MSDDEVVVMSELPRLLHKIQQIYIRLSIQKKVFLVFDVLLLLVSLMCYILVQNLSGIYNRQLVQSTFRLMDLYSSNIENDAGKINQLSMDILSNGTVQTNLPILNDSSNSTYEKAQALNSISGYLQSMSFAENYISSITMIDLAGDYRTVGNSTIDMDDAMRSSILNRLRGTNGALVWIEPLTGDSDKDIIAARKIRAVGSLKELGYEIIRVDPETLVESQSAVNPQYKVKLTILSASSQVMYRSQSIDLRGLRSIEASRSSTSIVHLADGQYLASRTTSPGSGWTYIYLLRYQEVMENMMRSYTISVIVFFLLLLLINLIGFYFAGGITKPIARLSLQMKSVQHGQFDIGGLEMVAEENCDEVGQLRNDFTLMVQKIQYLIRENYVKQILTKEAQLRALRAQINPHFLYNTLDSIYWIAKVNGQTRIASMTQALANLLRSSISGSRDTIPLKEELGLLNDYVMIQKVRFESRLNFQLEVDTTLQEEAIPQLTLQPIVENSIRYGLEKMTTPCTIRLYSQRFTQYFQIVIADNGNGFDPDRLPGNRQTEKSGMGIGLENIDRRFKLYYGDDFGLTIQSAPGKGTTVILKIPYRSGREKLPDSSLQGGSSDAAGSDR